MADYARGEKLRELREARRESQEFVAGQVGLSTKTVRTWEGGGKIRWANALKIAAYYGCDPEELVSRRIIEPVVSNGHVVTLESLETKLDEALSLLRALAADRQLADVDDGQQAADGRSSSQAG